MGPLTSTNDPFETKSWSFAVGAQLGDGNDLKGLASKNPDYNRIIRYGCRVFCVSQDIERAFKLDFYSRAYALPRMWAQYGGNHTGICLVFDKDDLARVIESSCPQNETLVAGSVLYGNHFDPSEQTWMRHMEAFQLSADDISVHGLETAVAQHRDRYSDVFFFRKAADWKHENEFRWIVRGETNTPHFIPFDSALRAIVIGTDFPPERVAEVHQFCSDLDLHVARIIWINGQPFVHWVPPDQVGTDRYRDIARHFDLLPHSSP